MVKTMGNVLEGVTASKVSLINEIKKDMINCKAKISMMTGSGTAVFGIFESTSELKDCYENLKSKYNEIFVTKTERGGVYIESRD
jgi:4-diphosphocytidyl-2-C-methyl-D-erythritol kinase